MSLTMGFVVALVVCGSAAARRPARLRQFTGFDKFGVCVLPADEQHLGAPDELAHHGPISVGDLGDDGDDDGGDVVACDARTRRLRQIIAFDGSGVGSSVVETRVNANTVACAVFVGGGDTEEDSGVVMLAGVDVATGRRFTRTIGAEVPASDSDGYDAGSVYALQSLQIGPSGAIAWLSQSSSAADAPPSSPTATLSVWNITVADRTGIRTVASDGQTLASGPPLTGLHITANTVTFTSFGTPTSVPVGSF